MTMNYVRKDISRSNDMYMELLQHAVDVNYSEMKDYNDERYNLDNYYTQRKRIKISLTSFSFLIFI